MPVIKPISDLRNYNQVLEKVSVGSPVYLTKNGHGCYTIMDINEQEEMYEKAMKIPDDVLFDYYKLTTDLDLAETDKLIKQDIIKAHKVYAEEIIKMYHGEEFIKQAEERYGKIVKGGIPENIKEVNLSSESSEFKLCDILVKVGFASSKSEARRMIQGNGVKVNSEVVNDINATIEIKGDVVIQFGKNKFIKVV